MAGSFIVGAGLEADTEEAAAVSVFGDFALGESSWVNGGVSRSDTGDGAEGLGAWAAQVGIEHRFGLLGLRAGAGYWGDSDLLDSNDVDASIFFDGDVGSLSFDYERREFDFVARAPFRPISRTVEFGATGLGVSARIDATDRSSLYAGGMRYDYSRDPRNEPRIDVLRFLLLTRLSMMNSLIEQRWHAGIEWQFGDRSLDLRYGNWRTAISGSRVQSLGVGWVTPAGSASDLELRVALDDSAEFGTAGVLSVFVYFFGG